MVGFTSLFTNFGVENDIVEKMMLLWAINCGFLIHTGLIWRDFELVPKKKFVK